jgi:L-threonylcarbamoyladenylate synthase
MSLPFLTPDDIERAIPAVRDHLAQGGLLGYPTETVYGLGSAPTETALDALADLKGRPPKKPFLLLVSSEKMPEEWGLVYSRAASALAAATTSTTRS